MTELDTRVVNEAMGFRVPDYRGWIVTGVPENDFPSQDVVEDSKTDLDDSEFDNADEARIMSATRHGLGVMATHDGYVELQKGFGVPETPDYDGLPTQTYVNRQFAPMSATAIGQRVRAAYQQAIWDAQNLNIVRGTE